MRSLQTRDNCELESQPASQPVVAWLEEPSGKLRGGPQLLHSLGCWKERYAEVIISQGPSADTNSFGSGRVPANPAGNGRLIVMVQVWETQITCPRSQANQRVSFQFRPLVCLRNINAYTYTRLSVFPYFAFLSLLIYRVTWLNPCPSKGTCDVRCR